VARLLLITPDGSNLTTAFASAIRLIGLELPDIAEKAERFTVLVGCWE
jgi:hypothetical protein